MITLLTLIPADQDKRKNLTKLATRIRPRHVPREDEPTNTYTFQSKITLFQFLSVERSGCQKKCEGKAFGYTMKVWARLETTRKIPSNGHTLYSLLEIVTTTHVQLREFKLVPGVLFTCEDDAMAAELGLRQAWLLWPPPEKQPNTIYKLPTMQYLGVG